MNLIKFPEQTLIIAEDQPEYQPLPAFRYAHDATGRIVCCWQLTWRERLRLLFRGKIWHTVLTFGQPLQPLLLQLEKPFTPEDVAASRAAQSARTAEKEFVSALLKKYGEKAQAKTQHMDALNYHPNDRRRTIAFAPEDFARAQSLNLLHLHGCRIVCEKPVVQPQAKQ